MPWLHLHYYATCHEDDYITNLQSRDTNNLMARRPRDDRNHVSVFRGLAEGERDISKQTLQTTKDLRRQQLLSGLP